MVNLIIHEPDIDKIDLYAKDPYEVKYQFKWFKIFYWIHKWYGDMDDIYKNIEEYS